MARLQHSLSRMISEAALGMALSSCLVCARMAAADTKPTGLVRLAVVPTAPVLDGHEARQKLLVDGLRSDGSTADLTSGARFVSQNPRIVTVDGEGVLHPVSDGRATVTLQAGGRTVTVPVVVRNTRRPFAWSFVNHVESVFSRQGCNMGACHGAGSGKGGFRLTLRAYDPDLDYTRLRYEGRGRRVVRTQPSDSLLLKKPALLAPHVGGLRLRRDSLEYRVVREWIANGAVGPQTKEPRIAGLSVYPNERTLLPNAQQSLLVTARFTDGHTEDVTHWARYSSNDDPIARVDESGCVTMRGKGETAITVWYLGKVTFVRVRVPFVALSSHPSPVKPAGNSIDSLARQKQAQLGLAPSPLCTDAEFVRRAFLDTIGTLPMPEETRAFLTDRSSDKRNRLIDRLLDRPEYVDFWTYKWGDLLRVSRDLLGNKGMASLHAWVRQSVADNKPWDRFARELLTASGSASEGGPVNFYRMGTKPEEFAETVSQAFLGIRVQCAHCHNHPFEKWTQADYYRMANFFARVGKKGEGDGEIVFAAATGDVMHPKLGRPLPPAAFDGPSLPLDALGDRRVFLADWMTSPCNPYFARAVVNRVWKQFFGRGLVEPIDDMRLTNPSSNDPLFAAVTQDFVAHGYDLKYLMRTILQSQAYQRSSAPNATNRNDDRFYSHYLPRRLTAESLLDALCQATGTPERFKGVPVGSRAISLPDTRVDSTFLDIFGRPARQVTCECERNMEPNMAQALHLINANLLNSKITAKGGTLEHLLKSAENAKGTNSVSNNDSTHTDNELLDTLYLTALCRFPTPAERTAVQHALASMPPAPAKGEKAMDRQTLRGQVFADLFWALLSSPEFVFNH